MSKKLWADALELVKQSKVSSVTLRYVNAHDQLVEDEAPLDNLNECSLEDGIKLETGAVVYPDPATAVLNPFVDPPVFRFVCNMQKRPFEAVRVIPGQAPESSSLSSPVSSIFPLTIAGRPVKELPQLESKEARTPAKNGHSRAHAAAAAAAGSDQHTGSAASVSIYSGGSPSEASHRGTSCHQCKNARPFTQLAFCSSLFNKRTSNEMRNCRKKFCQGCLQKFYCDSIDNSRSKQGWVCPSCRGICRCAACARKRQKNKQVIGAAFQQVSGAALGAVFDQQMRNLSNLVLPDGQDFMHSNPNTFNAMVTEAGVNGTVENSVSGGDALVPSSDTVAPVAEQMSSAENKGPNTEDEMTPMADDDIVPSAEDDREPTAGDPIPDKGDEDEDDDHAKSSSSKKAESARATARKSGRNWPYDEQLNAAKRSARVSSSS